MKWKIRLARDMTQEAFVVIDAPTSEEAEAILWHGMDPDVSAGPTMTSWATVRSLRSVQPTIRKSSPRSKCHRFDSPKA
jgi:hypothetical protein